MSATILIVDDERNHRDICALLLQRSGYRVLVAEDGEEGARIAAESRPDLVLMDFRMPGLTGIDTLRRLRADPATATTPVVALTADLLRFSPAAAEEAGFCDYIPKPSRAREILRAVERIVGPAAAAG